MLCERHPGSELGCDIGFLVKTIDHLLPAHNLGKFNIATPASYSVQWVGNGVSVSWVTTMHQPDCHLTVGSGASS